MNEITAYNLPSIFCRQWEAARDEARDLDKYAPNWDEADADPVPLEVIQKTLRVFRHLEEMNFSAPDLVYPAADGTVFLEWHHPDGSVQVVNICQNRVHLVAMGPDGSIIPLAPDISAGVVGAKCSTARGDSDNDGDAFEFALAA